MPPRICRSRNPRTTSPSHDNGHDGRGDGQHGGLLSPPRALAWITPRVCVWVLIALVARTSVVDILVIFRLDQAVDFDAVERGR